MALCSVIPFYEYIFFLFPPHAIFLRPYLSFSLFFTWVWGQLPCMVEAQQDGTAHPGEMASEESSDHISQMISQPREVSQDTEQQLL